MPLLTDITIKPFLISLLLSVLCVPVTVLFFQKKQWLVDPKKTPHPAHTHTQAVPKGGGLAVLIPMLIGVFLSITSDKHILAIAIAAVIVVGVGVWDDIKGLNPYFRLVTNFIAAGVVVASGIGISFITNPFGGVIDLSWPRLVVDFFGRREIWILADLFALLWIPALMNAINWSSGVDGQISGVVTISALFLGLLSLNYSADITQWPVSILAFSLAGSTFGLTLYHFYPQKIMPGYSGTSLFGLILGVLAILATGKVGTAMLLLAVPILDFLYVIAVRISKGKSPVWGGSEHLHHRLLKIGWGKRRIAVFYWSITALMGVIALNIEARYKLFVMLGLVLLVLISWIWQFFGRFSNR